MIELRCSRDLALRLGAVVPGTTQEHRQLRDSGRHMLIRDVETGWALFWPLQQERAASNSSSPPRYLLP
jgi:hypothetical protein